ncbi:hypothetical protein [Sphingomonas carotinifaciens]|uniref:Uncharacterized protein n=1 Tax=Sphingomonas carotinifaciens TaxID=1166323 RepID=A0A1G7RTD1_9SPHN|nr:hypothetical protein [Sphingomonas carotinifaciens]MBB4088131.1 hypothetical protein [Sphingomonas carotinifaciens]MWC43817.1 hypothetical protein [Sphingomonas carotinifaciens]SDG14016.1 hypothetical protein SAMN05216557_11418 [Sphingomonas carotinifaciens]
MPRHPKTARLDSAWRVPGHGLRDILNLLDTPAARAAILDTAPPMVTGILTGQSGAPARFHVALDRLHGTGDDKTGIVQLLDGSLDDPAALCDATLLGDLIIPEGYEPTPELGDWVSSNLPPSLATDLGIDPVEHAASLRMLRGSDRESWSLLVGGRLGTAACLDRSFHGCSVEASDRIIRTQALLFYVIATRMRAALIRRWTTRPMTEAIRYEMDWQYRGRMMMTALVAPARQIEAVWNEAVARPEHDRLAGSFLANPNLIGLAEAVQRRVPLLAGRRAFPDAARLMQQHLASPLRTLAAVTPEQTRDAGLGMQDFVEARLGVPAPHATVILAAALLSAPRHIDATIEAARARVPLPAVPDPIRDHKPGRRALTRTTQLLRLQGRTDRHAQSYGNGDVDDAAGRKMVRKALDGFAHRHPAHAIHALRIDPAWWTGR